MLTGTIMTLALYVAGFLIGYFHKGYDPGIGAGAGAFVPYYLLGFDPCVWGLTSSLFAGIVVSLLTPPPDPRRVSLLFDKQPPTAPAPATLDLHPELQV